MFLATVALVASRSLAPLTAPLISDKYGQVTKIIGQIAPKF
jgi:hypothetical protein